jgi:hypothetical protein
VFKLTNDYHIQFAHVLHSQTQLHTNKHKHKQNNKNISKQRQWYAANNASMCQRTIPSIKTNRIHGFEIKRKQTHDPEQLDNPANVHPTTLEQLGKPATNVH